jgi:hypothetical protein
MADDNVDGGSDYNEGNLSYVCAAWAPILGFAGIASAVVFASKFPRPLVELPCGFDCWCCSARWQDLIVPFSHCFRPRWSVWYS